MSGRELDPRWQRFSSVTRARIGLGRAGDALPTARALEFSYAHACARDAVSTRVDFDTLAAQLTPQLTLRVHSAAPDRPAYLRRPDLGRALRVGEAAMLPTGPYEAVVVIADGLSASAVQTHAVPVVKELIELLPDWVLGPIVLADQARVALGDEIGAIMRASMLVMLIGERPGLTAPNSLGIYLTYAPHVGRRDSERNCISNVHGDGLAPGTAARKLVWLMSHARRLQLTGVALKEDAPQKPLDSKALELPCSGRD